MSRSKSIAAIAAISAMVVAGGLAMAQNEGYDACIDACQQAEDRCVDACDAHDNPVECEEHCQDAAEDCSRQCR